MKSIIEKFKNQMIVIIGDFCIDEFHEGVSTRLSPEAPVPVIKNIQKTISHGMSGNVLANLHALGSKDSFLMTVGPNSIENNKIQVIREDRPITKKIRIFSNGHQVCRLDEEVIKDISQSSIDEICGLINHLTDAGPLTVILQDYGKGAITEHLIKSLLESIDRKNLFLCVDPTPGATLDKYHGVDLIKANLSEARALTGFNEELSFDLLLNMTQAIKSHGIKNVVITLGDKGMFYSDEYNCYDIILPIKVTLVDVTGAGDTAIAAIALTLSSGSDLRTACEIANIASSIVVSKPRCVPCSYDELINKINLYI